MFDFATHAVGTKIFCESPSEDTHEVENLISANKNLPGCFFLASHFVKPPCDIILSLPFAINLQSIGVNPRATSICSDVISIFICDKGWEEISKQRDPHSFYKYCGTFEDLSSKATNYVYMENTMYKENPRFPNVEAVAHSGVKFVKNMYSMHNVKSIKLRINKVARSGPPCLKGVEVWGQPNAHNDASVLSSFFTLASKATNNQIDASTTEKGNVFKPLSLFASSSTQPTQISTNKPTLLRKKPTKTDKNQIKPDTNQTHTNTNTNTTNNKHPNMENTEKGNFIDLTSDYTPPPNPVNSHNSYDIPPHFMDPITCDVMREPVILPSGHTVDKSTIMRHLASHTTDPFSRLTMEISDVKPDLELQKQIETLLATRKRKSEEIYSSIFPGKGYKLGRLEGNAEPPPVHPLVAKFSASK